jgi:thiamine biosynthesis lipoprotein
MRNSHSLILFVAFLLFIPSCQREKEVKRKSLIMDTTVEITALGEDEEFVSAALEQAFSELRRIEARYSFYREDSVISRINQAAGIRPVEVDEETLKIITESLEFSRISRSAFDISFAALSGWWNPAQPPESLPTSADLKPVLEKVGYEKIKVDPVERTVFFLKDGMRIDLGGVVKGYAVDRAIHVLREAGVRDALVNVGGDLRAMGRHRGRAWRIGIQNPRRRGGLLGRMSVEDKAVATSGDYERFFMLDGRRYSHIIDPRTGFPAGGCQSVTVVADTAMFADALATAVFVLGAKEGLSLIESLPRVQGLVIDSEGFTHLSSGLQGQVEWF